MGREGWGTLLGEGVVRPGGAPPDLGCCREGGGGRGGGGAGDPDNRLMLACGLRNLRSIIYFMHHVWV